MQTCNINNGIVKPHTFLFLAALALALLPVPGKADYDTALLKLNSVVGVPGLFDAVPDRTGSIHFLGVPELEAERHERKIKDRSILISVHIKNSEEITRAKDIFTNAGAQHICTTGESSKPEE